MDNLLTLSGIEKHYLVGKEAHQVLHPISISIKPGELVAIVGASGSGKSTLMNIMGLLETADAGEYQLFGHGSQTLSIDEAARFRNEYIGFVFQQFHLLPRLSVLQNVALPLIYRGETRQCQEKVEATLAKVGMEAYLHHLPSQLSGGQQQRVAIARALIGQPKLILADEPTGALDSTNGKHILDLFLTLHREGHTIVIVTHDEHIANRCLRKIMLADGKIISDTEGMV